MQTDTLELPKEMKYQQLFVRFERREKQSLITVLIDYNYLDAFHCDTNDQDEFDRACNDYLSSLRYKQKLKEFHSR